MDPATIPVPKDVTLPLPVPEPVLVVLLVLFFLFHIVFVKLTVGGTLLTLYCEIRGLFHADYDRLARRIAATISVNKSMAVVLGVGPLLAINLLYTAHFYSANAVLGNVWMLIVPLVTVAFLLTYLHQYTWDTLREHKGLHIAQIAAAAVIFLTIPLIFLSNMAVMLYPEQWPAGRGFIGALLLPNVLPRYLLFIALSLMVTALFLIRWLNRPAVLAKAAFIALEPARLTRGLYSLALVTASLALLLEPLVFATLPAGGVSGALVVLLGVSALVAVPAIWWMWQEVVAPAAADVSGKRYGRIVALLALSLIGIAAGRQLHRATLLEPHRQAIAARTAAYSHAVAEAAQGRFAADAAPMAAAAGPAAVPAVAAVAPATPVSGGVAPAANDAGPAPALFAQSCKACHAVDKRLIGPPLTEIAAAYAGKPEGIVAWAKKPGRKRTDYPVMPPMPFPDADLLAVANYMLAVGGAKPAAAAPQAPAATAPRAATVPATPAAGPAAVAGQPADRTVGSGMPVLLISGQNNHDWVQTDNFLMAMFAAKSGFAVTETLTPAKGAPAAAWDAWRPEFSKYACVLLNYNGEMWPEAVQKGFLDYVNGGGGVVLIHASNNSFNGWKEFEQMVGLLWRPKEFGLSEYLDEQGKPQFEKPGEGRNMGHGKQWDFQLTVRDAQNPITAGMPAVWRHVKDELYHGQRGPAEGIHVLLSSFSDPAQNGTGKNEPIVWWTSYGKGKVLTNVMGHAMNAETPSLSCVGFQTVLLRSLEWVATGKVATKIPEDFPTAERTSQRYYGKPVKVAIEDLTKQQATARLKLPPGYHAELVASEPDIINPVMCAWDGNGRMYVAEMRSYMMDADRTRQDEPISRVTRLTASTPGGVLDRATVYADKLVLPRMILPLDDRVLINETYNGKYVLFQDKNGDGIADERKEVCDVGVSKANLEHQDSGMLWNIDNYIYTAQTSSRRFRFTKDVWETDQITGGRSSQWGLTMDDTGRMFGSAAGGERSAYGFQQYTPYGDLLLPNELEEGFDETFPALQTVDVQGGPGRIHPVKGSLNHFTGCGGQSIFRGENMPADLLGDYLLPEPVGRLVRRAKVNVVAGKRVLSNVYPGDEFITSTDPCFRPVWSATGPDGCLYIVDMHHGIIQEGNWVNEGSYLRSVVLRDGYDKYIGHGRIYRIVADGFRPGPQPKMLDEPSAALVRHLTHANGWWRDTAQKLLVLRHDRSVVPALVELVRSGPTPLSRLHALWTLDGLEASDKEVVRKAMADPDERVRVGAVRIAENLIRKGDATLLPALAPLVNDASIDVVVQVLNTLRYAPPATARPLLEEAGNKLLGNEIVTATAQQTAQFDPSKPAAVAVKIDPVGLAMMAAGRDHFAQICFACHGVKGQGEISSDKIALAPPLAGSKRVQGSPEALVRIVLNGLTGNIDGKAYPGLMVPQKDNDDQWIAETLTYVRNSWGNQAGTITKEEVARIRTKTGDHPPFTLEELAMYLPVDKAETDGWNVTASNNPGEARHALDGDPATRWSTNTAQKEGQWFQLDLKKPYEISRVAVDTSGSANDFVPRLKLMTSEDGTTWNKTLATVPGKVVTIIDLPPGTKTRYLRLVRDTGNKGGYWSIHELAVYGSSVNP